jgi:hypothetical protein
MRGFLGRTKQSWPEGSDLFTLLVGDIHGEDWCASWGSFVVFWGGVGAICK